MALNLTAKDFAISALAALLPTALTSSITIAYGLLSPASEVRAFGSMLNASSFYIEIENHDVNPLKTISISVPQAKGLRVLTQNRYAEIKIEEAKDNAVIKISAAEPQMRTVILLGADASLDAGEIHFFELPPGTSFVPSTGYETLNFSKRFWLPIIVQLSIFYGLFLIASVFRKQSLVTLVKAEKKIDEVTSKMDALQLKSDVTVKGLQKSISEIRSASAKYRLYSRWIYKNLEKENSFWRSTVSMAFRSSVDIPGSSDSLIKLILKRCGIRTSKEMKEMNIDMLIMALEEKEGRALEMNQQFENDRIQQI